MSFVVVATIVPLPEHRDEVIATITETVDKVHKEDGCELYALHQTDDRLMMVENGPARGAARAQQGRGPGRAGPPTRGQARRAGSGYGAAGGAGERPRARAQL